MNTALIQRLADNQPHDITQLMRYLSLSESQLQQQIHALIELGIEIKTTSSHYQLKQPLDLLNKVQILALIPQSIKTQIDFFEIYPLIDSTNTFLLTRDATLKIQICMAEMQTKGRGRRGRTWFSPYASNLYLSVLKQFNLTMNEVAGLSILSALSLLKVLRKYGIEAGVKWPNDIYYQDKKIAGILLEVAAQSKEKVNVIIGIGLNINMPKIAQQKIDQAWNDLSQQKIKRNLLAADILIQLIQMLEQYQQEKLDKLYLEWQHFDIWLNKRVILHFAKQQIEGICRGINNKGALCLEVSGKIKTFQVGEVSLRKK